MKAFLAGLVLSVALAALVTSCGGSSSSKPGQGASVSSTPSQGGTTMNGVTVAPGY